MVDSVVGWEPGPVSEDTVSKGFAVVRNDGDGTGGHGSAPGHRDDRRVGGPFWLFGNCLITEDGVQGTMGRDGDFGLFNNTRVS